MTHRHAVVVLLVLAACGDGTTTPDGAVDAGPRTDMGTGGGDAGPACRSDVDCNDGLYCTGIEACAPSNPHADARGCFTSGSPCLASQSCNEAMHRCVAMGCTTPDADGDGHPSIDCGGDDCDDADANRYAGNAEVCDVAGHDEDCDTATFGFRDADGDGAPDSACCNTPATGSPVCGTDCNDANTNVHPGATEACNGMDDDCNGMTDEGGVLVTFYVDCDGDGHGERAGDTPACTNPGTGALFPLTMMACSAPPSYSAQHDDCDDAPSPALGALSHPGLGETCDGVDNDCNGVIDDGLMADRLCVDADNDTYVTASCVTGCAARVGYRDVTMDPSRDPTLHPTAVDCNDTDMNVHPGATDACGMDLDCIPGVMGGSGLQVWYVDCDGDGHGSMARAGEVMMHCGLPAAPACTPPGGTCMAGLLPTSAGWTTNPADDCDDWHDTIFPGAPSASCDDADTNCDGSLEAVDDRDGDGYSSCGCRAIDCNDASGIGATVHPGAAEVPGDGIDENCDAHEDCYADADGDHERTTTTTSTTDVTCSAAPHALASVAAGDCCDTDAGANHSVGSGTYFAVADVCGSFDYDCNGTEQPRYTSTSTGACHEVCVPPPPALCMDTVCRTSGAGGWMGTVPACGATGSFYGACEYDSGGVCGPVATTQTQICH